MLVVLDNTYQFTKTLLHTTNILKADDAYSRTKLTPKRITDEFNTYT